MDPSNWDPVGVRVFEVLGFFCAGAEHSSFLTKLKEKLHIGPKHKEEKVAAPVESKSASDDQVAAAPVAAPLAPLDVPAASAGVAPEEHHGGTPTFLAALPDQDIPAEDSPTHPELHHGASPVESEEVAPHHGVVPDGGVPTFLAALPDQDIPAEVTKGVESAPNSDDSVPQESV